MGKGLFADVDNSPETLNKKIRNGEIAQYNFIFGALCPCALPLHDASPTHFDFFIPYSGRTRGA